MKLSALFLAIAFFSLCGTDAFAITPSFSNLNYAGGSNSKHTLDIYIPTSATSPTATIVHIHGGAFLSGSKSTTDQSSYQYFYNNGFVCVDINYRLSSDSIWPAQIFDCKAAIRFLKANADLYHIDTNKIGVIGESAGGYLVSMLGTTADVAELEGTHLGNANVSSRVHAVVDLFGPINFSTMDAEATALGFTINTNAATSPESKLMGAAIPTIPERVSKANPTTYISNDDADFFISAGTADKNIPYTQGQNFNTSLENVVGNQRTTFELLQGAGHGGSVWHSTVQDEKYLNFFKKAFGTISSIESPSLNNNSMRIFPNIATDEISIELDDFATNTETNQHLKIFNSYGEMVMDIDCPQNSSTINLDVSMFHDGLYHLSIGESHQKFIVVR